MKVFFSPEYLVPGSEFETVEKAAWIVDPPALDPRVLLRAHGEVYIDAIHTGVSRELAEAQGFPWNDRLGTSSAASAVWR